MANEVIKNISIDIGNSPETRSIGAEAQYVEVARDSNGVIIEDITIESPYQKEGLAKTLKNLEENGGAKYTKDGEDDSYATVQNAVEDVTIGGTIYYKNVATGLFSHAEGEGVIANNEASHAEGMGTSASGVTSHAEGNQTIANGEYSHAECNGTRTDGDSSHAEGNGTRAGGSASHAEGNNTKAIATSSHAEGYGTTANGSYSHTEGYQTSTGGSASHAEGYQTIAHGMRSHAEGFYTTAHGMRSHAEGERTSASGDSSHAEGERTSASGFYSHAEGERTIARGTCSHAGGLVTIANYCQTVVGQNNVDQGLSESYAAHSGYFIVGSGTDTALDNCFRATETNTYGKTYSTSGADYAEMFEWLDSNLNNEDRAGKFVTLDGDKIKLATSEDDYIIGIVSGNASVIGDVYDDQWQGAFETDIYGRPIYTKQHVDAVLDEEGNELIPAHDNDVLKVSSDYDNTKTYIPRSQRPEWDAVGLIGKLVCLDDGTAVVNQYVKPNDDSIATHSDERTKYRVMERIDKNHIRVMIL